MADRSTALTIVPSRRRRGRLVVLLVLSLLVVVELVGRAYGLHKPIIYEPTDYGYRVAPDQDIRRFGHVIRYNDIGLRNGPITARPAPGATRVLCLGDSVTNGGAITDQSDTISSRLEDALRHGGGTFEVLNASAPGWAIANELGWLRGHGTLGSRYVVLVLSTHDLFQEMAPASTVGSHPSFPDSRPVLAIEELVQRYLLPRLIPGVASSDPGAGGVEASDAAAARNREDLAAIADIVAREQGRLLVIFLKQSDEVQDQRTWGFKRQFRGLLARRGIPVATLDEELQDRGHAVLYRDGVHPNADGNRAIALLIARSIESMENGKPGGATGAASE